jgi:hypothetical protein
MVPIGDATSRVLRGLYPQVKLLLTGSAHARLDQKIDQLPRYTGLNEFRMDMKWQLEKN